MQEHLSRAELQAYMTRQLAARELQRVDQHLAQCPACKAQLLSLADVRSATRVLRAVQRAEPHLSYEQLEAYVEARLPAAERAAVVAHANRCARCAAEIADLQACAGELSRKLGAAPAAAPASFIERLGAWFGAGAMPRVALALFVGAIALTLVWRDPFSSGERQSDAIGTPGGPAGDAVPYDRGALDSAGVISAAAAAAQRAGDDAALARALEPLATQGDPRAQSALGLLYAEGRGVARDARAAEYWWARAANRDRSARINLQLLRDRATSPGGKAP